MLSNLHEFEKVLDLLLLILDACDGCKYDAILSSVNPLNDCKYRNENEQESIATHKIYNTTINSATEAGMQMQQQTLQVTDADIMLMPTTSSTATTASAQLPQYLPRPMQTIRIAVSQPTNSDTSTMTRYVALPSNNCRFILPTVVPHGPVSVAASHRYAHNLTGVTTPTIYFPIPNNSTLPRASFAHTLNRYESISPQQISTTAATSTNAIDSYAVTNSPMGLRRTNVLTNPLSPELTTLRKTNTRLSNTNYENAIDSIHNMKNINHNELTTLPTQHTLDCKVAIMEDEEENEQRRLGNCPQGTPSRVPLISAHRNYEQRGVKDLGAKDNSLRNKRGRIGVSFQRHTFQRRNANGAYVKPQTCDMHNGVKRQRRSYCGDLVDASDDEEYMQHNSGCYMLKRLDNEIDSADENYNEEVEETVGGTERPQIPISIVVLLLIAYICLGAGIFAIWENWSLIDGAYFCFVTLTTIGYGDFVPEHILRSADIHLLTFCAYLLIGLILVAMSLSILETQLLWKCKRIAVRLKLVK